MDFSQSIQLLKDAEKMLLTHIADAGDDDNYDELRKCLSIAQEIRGIREELVDLFAGTGGLDKRKEQIPDEHLFSSESCDASLAEAFPVYFICDGKLFKIAERGAETGGLYKKSISIDDAQKIFSAMLDLLSGNDEVSVTDVEFAMGGEPRYKIQLAISALMHIGRLKKGSRGSYTLVEGARRSVDDWMAALASLRPRPDLIAKATGK